MLGRWWSSVGWVAVVWAAAFVGPCSAGDPFAYFDFDVSYITASPLGVPQQVTYSRLCFRLFSLHVYFLDLEICLIRRRTCVWFRDVDWCFVCVIGLLESRDGIQHRKNCWQDGVLGTNCPIPQGWNWTYQFQVKDQIGSFFYFPSLGLQRAAGGYGGITVNNREVIAVPFGNPDGDITLFIGDWYIKSHKDLRKALDEGKDLGMPDGVLMNGKGPYRYNTTLVPDGIDYETINVFPGAWTAVLVSLDSVGFWNVRVENLDTWYLGQEVYVRVVNPEDNSNKTELPVPDNVLYCGLLKDKQKYV
ncbi:hypothetical protein BHE74_00024535 [Ensete ventricosum]|nr:hypothetical protein BHE74_00024535 [Ensete ventricosum]